MKNCEIEETINALRSIDCPVPFRTGLALAENIERLEKANDARVQAHNAIIKKYSKDGKTVTASDDLDACRKEISELLLKDAAVELQKVKADDLEGARLTVKQAKALKEMIE